LGVDADINQFPTFLAWHIVCSSSGIERQKTMDGASDLHTIVRALAEVWLARPQASDTAEGIGRWWFDREGIVTNKELVNALEWMVRHELIAEVDAVDGRCRYCRAASDDQFIAVIVGTASD
jgi:hypothetical protein